MTRDQNLINYDNSIIKQYDKIEELVQNNQKFSVGIFYGLIFGITGSFASTGIYELIIKDLSKFLQCLIVFFVLLFVMVLIIVFFFFYRRYTKYLNEINKERAEFTEKVRKEGLNK